MYKFSDAALLAAALIVNGGCLLAAAYGLSLLGL